MEVINRYIAIKNHANDAPQDSDFKLKSSPLTLSMDPGSDEFIVRNLYVSIDPFQLNRMKSYSSSQESSKNAVAIIPGEAINTYGDSRVVASENSKFEKGDIVTGFLNWEEFTVVKAGGMLNKLDPMGFPLSYHVGILGSTTETRDFRRSFSIVDSRRSGREHQWSNFDSPGARLANMVPVLEKSMSSKQLKLHHDKGTTSRLLRSKTVT
ncbi:common plant regulatory factor 1-like [Hibiscus syriacus]|uniref:Common plant regulatory factor 1-like n=1 Tax=Hibiscus syriacus TaxID=106335 RepID=A0A6A2Z8Y0_HIBSY|nr:common plant regulatory factor 1-like [Hibiscus syriacus]